MRGFLGTLRRFAFGLFGLMAPASRAVTTTHATTHATWKLTEGVRDTEKPSTRNY
jgi:hypothetical protein